jgi:hypothetical protein
VFAAHTQAVRDERQTALVAVRTVVDAFLHHGIVIVGLHGSFSFNEPLITLMLSHEEDVKSVESRYEGKMASCTFAL